MKDSRRRRVIGPWILAGGLLVAVALLRALAAPGGEGRDTILAPTVAVAAEPAALAPPRAEPPAAGIERVEVQADDEPQAPPAPRLRSVAYVGRIAGVRGEPIAGATVWLIPDSATLRATGHPLAALQERDPDAPTPTTAELLAALTPTSFTSSESDLEGRFRITAELAHAPPASRAGERVHPELFAKQGSSRPALHVCREPLGDDAADAAAEPIEIDIGVLTLLPGVTVQGRVVNELFAPIAQVDVEVTAPTAHAAGDRAQSPLVDFGHVFAASRSGADGRFRLEGLAESTDRPLRVRLERPGHDEVRRDVFAGAGETAELGDVVIERGLAIAGRVLDERGQPLADVPVRLTDEAPDRWGQDRHSIELEVLAVAVEQDVEGVLGPREARFTRAVTGADGRFEIGGLAPRVEYAAYAAVPGREPARATRLMAGGSEIELRLPARTSLQLVLVEEPGGAKLADATVRAYRQLAGGFYPPELGSMPVRRDADESSQFVVDEVCPAPLGVFVDSPSLGKHALFTIGVELGATAELRVLRVPRGATIGGLVVLTTTGEPVPGALVTLTFMQGGDVAGLLQPIDRATGDSGQFRFEGLAPGPLRLDASGAGVLDASGEWTVAPGETRLDVTLAVEPAARFAGTVTVAGRGPAEGVVVAAKAYADAWRSVGLARTAADGGYAVQVPPGSWVLEFMQETPGGSVWAWESASVAAGQVTRVDAELPAPARLSGIVLSTGLPVRDASIAVSGKDVHLTLVADADGRFETEVVGCGELVLLARSPRGGISEPAHVMAEPGGNAWAELRFGGRTLTGRVLDATGAPVAQAGVLILVRDRQHAPAPEGGRVLTDAEGRFTCEDLSLGEFTVQADHPDFLTAQAPLTIAPGDRAPAITLEMSRAHSLEGTVRTPDGKPASSLLVVMAWEYGDKPVGQAAIEESGHYSLPALPAGHYTVSVHIGSLARIVNRSNRERLELGHGYVTVKDGQDVQLDITLDPDD